MSPSLFFLQSFLRCVLSFLFLLSKFIYFLHSPSFAFLFVLSASTSSLKIFPSPTRRQWMYFDFSFAPPTTSSSFIDLAKKLLIHPRLSYFMPSVAPSLPSRRIPPLLPSSLLVLQFKHLSSIIMYCSLSSSSSNNA